MGVDSKDLAWDLLPVQSVDTTRNLGAGGIVLDHKEGWEGQGEAPLTLVKEVGSLGVPLDAVEMVIRLGTFSGVLVVGGALGAGVLCYWICRVKPAGGIPRDDELGMRNSSRRSNTPLAVHLAGSHRPSSRTPSRVSFIF
jgi:hypothetical protein